MFTYRLKKNSLFCRFFAALMLFTAAAFAPAEVPVSPFGADTVPDLYAPNIAGPGGFSTSQGGAPASALNPAQGGDARRIMFDVGYLAIPCFGIEQGYAQSIEAGMLYPTRVGVFGGALRFIGSSFDESFPVGNTFSGNLSAAKELYPGMSIGAGFNFGFGSGLTLSGDLGFRYNMGKLGPLQNFTWAAAVRGMGKSWTPTWFTPIAGVSFDLIRVEGENQDPFALNLSGDLSFPSIVYFPQTSMIFKVGVEATIAEIITISASWPGASGLNARELAQGAQFPSAPSIGIGVDLVLPSGGKRIAGGRLPSDGDLALNAAFKPLYNDIYAMGLGATWSVGVLDKKPPLIQIEYPEPVYFSPNNDGKADYLEFPMSITDDHYIESWEIVIKDEEGNVTRNFKNKELRPETQGVKNFFSRLFAVKAGVEVPQSFRWDGIKNTGELAPDGKYFFTITAVDDNGNTAVSEVYQTVLDNTPPVISIAPMSEVDRIFSPDGDGNKDTITFVPNGSEEELWESGIWNAAGAKIRSFAGETGKPAPRTWDGKDDNGSIVPDGVYSYRITSTDRAQNTAGAAMENIIVNTIQPTVSLVIADPWFSPNGDGIKDTVLMTPVVPVKEGISAWSVRVLDSKGDPLRTISASTAQSATVPDRVEFDGMNSGAVLPEGAYQAELSVTYRNGYVSTALSPLFYLDITPPRASVSAEYSAFSPDNDGIQDEMIIHQEGSDELVWTGEVRRANGPAGEKPVRAFRFSGTPPATITWDGHGDAGTFAADGEYTYELYATDRAGNTGRSNQIRFMLSTADTPVMITTDLRAFSPNGDRVKDTINLIPQIQVREGISNWRVSVLDGRNNPVRIFEGTGLPPAQINWNGGTTGSGGAAGAFAPDGTYTAKIELRYVQGNQPSAVSLPFVLKTRPPKGEVSVPYTLFAPNGNGKRDTLPFTLSAESGNDWTAIITNAKGETVRRWNWNGDAPALRWDGKDEAGNSAPDGTYQFTLQASDEAGNSTRVSVPNIVLDARIPRVFLTSSATGIAPKAAEQRDLVRFNIICAPQDGIESWNLELKDEAGRTVKRFANDNAAGRAATAPPASVSWNGLAENGAVTEGRYTPTLTVNYLKGDSIAAQAAPVTVDISGPALSLNYRPEYFSPDNDGVDDELFITLGAKDASPIASWSLEIREPAPPYLLFWRVEGKGSPTEQLVWDGRSNKGELVQAATDYPYTYRAVDSLGNSSSIEGKIGVDVLVIRDGDRLKIQVPSIIFRENAADFNSLQSGVVDNNLRVLRRVAEILNKFKDYRVQVEGHANPVLRTAAEEQKELQPLSESRARAVVSMLVEFGVNRSRLSAVGMGGSRPVVRFEDHDNWWKNRRVEFILIR
jgi:outer membrane protein OmpA-like peptidoglycan-associated protein/flagellar hook assembly protein FlgD